MLTLAKAGNTFFKVSLLGLLEAAKGIWVTSGLVTCDNLLSFQNAEVGYSVMVQPMSLAALTPLVGIKTGIE